MSPTSKSILCAVLLAIIADWVTALYWLQRAGSFVARATFVTRLILFGRLFKMPLRSDAHRSLCQRQIDAYGLRQALRPHLTASSLDVLTISLGLGHGSAR